MPGFIDFYSCRSFRLLHYMYTQDWEATSVRKLEPYLLAQALVYLNKSKLPKIYVTMNKCNIIYNQISWLFRWVGRVKGRMTSIIGVISL